MCTFPGCERAWVGYRGGWLHGLCQAHEVLALQAFGPLRSPVTRASTSVSVPASAGSHKAAAVGTSAPG
jgi:hypothetical protein